VSPGKQVIILAERDLERPGGGETIAFHMGCLTSRCNGRGPGIALSEGHLQLCAERWSDSERNCADQKQSKAVVAKSVMHDVLHAQDCRQTSKLCGLPPQHSEGRRRSLAGPLERGVGRHSQPHAQGAELGAERSFNHPVGTEQQFLRNRDDEAQPGRFERGLVHAAEAAE
jgi:hypothetical protein